MTNSSEAINTKTNLWNELKNVQTKSCTTVTNFTNNLISKLSKALDLNEGVKEVEISSKLSIPIPIGKTSVDLNHKRRALSENRQQSEGPKFILEKQEAIFKQLTKPTSDFKTKQDILAYPLELHPLPKQKNSINASNFYELKPTSFNDVASLSTERCSIISERNSSLLWDSKEMEPTNDTNSNMFRSVLGPTPDESILAGLQTVMDRFSSSSRNSKPKYSESKDHDVDESLMKQRISSRSTQDKQEPVMLESRPLFPTPRVLIDSSSYNTNPQHSKSSFNQSIIAGGSENMWKQNQHDKDESPKAMLEAKSTPVCNNTPKLTSSSLTKSKLQHQSLVERSMVMPNMSPTSYSSHMHSKTVAKCPSLNTSNGTSNGTVKKTVFDLPNEDQAQYRVRIGIRQASESSSRSHKSKGSRKSKSSKKSKRSGWSHPSSSTSATSGRSTTSLTSTSKSSVSTTGSKSTRYTSRSARSRNRSRAPSKKSKGSAASSKRSARSGKGRRTKYKSSSRSNASSRSAHSRGDSRRRRTRRSRKRARNTPSRTSNRSRLTAQNFPTVEIKESPRESEYRHVETITDYAVHTKESKKKNCPGAKGKTCPPTSKRAQYIETMPDPTPYTCYPDTCGHNLAEEPGEVRYALTIISKFSDYTTYEVLKSSSDRPKKICNVTEGVFVVKKRR